MSEDLERAIGPDRRTFVKRLVIGTAFAAPIVSSFRMSGIDAIFGGSAGATTAMSNANTAPYYPAFLGTVNVPASASANKSFSGPPATTIIVQPNTFSVPMSLTVKGGHPANLAPFIPAGYTLQSAVAVEWTGAGAAFPITLQVTDPAVQAGDELFEFVDPPGIQPYSGTVNPGSWLVTFQTDPAFLVARPPAAPPPTTPPANTPAATEATAPHAVEAGPATAG